MKYMLKSDKRGISVIIGYVILIGIAIGLSVLVYNWLVFTIPGEEVECPESINLDLREISCSRNLNELNFTVRNNGLFSFDGFIVKVNFENPYTDDEARIGIHDIGGDDGVFNQKISPGEDYKVEIDYSSLQNPFPLSILEVLPFLINEDGRRVICYPSTRVRVNCN